MTDAELIDRLIGEVARADDWRCGAVLPGLLPLYNYWGPVLYLTTAGEVVRNEEEGGPLRPADPTERGFGLARAAALHPELAHLRPPRPETADTCHLCGGHGRLANLRGRLVWWPDREDSANFLYCPECSSLGWTVTG